MVISLGLSNFHQAIPLSERPLDMVLMLELLLFKPMCMSWRPSAISPGYFKLAVLILYL